jgi:sigma-B regulation protein RsbU (phosphoserine phosphatase)
MNNPTEFMLREQLLDRRERLQTSIPLIKQNDPLLQLLKEVDLALEKLNSGSYGLCETCREPIERDRLLSDPLTRYCIDHLTADQQRALEQDLDLAWKIQNELLPKPELKLAGWEVSYHYEPLGPVSGDYCDIIPIPDDSGFFFALGDVAGKGVAASMLMSHLHAMFRSLATVGLPFDQLVSRANRVFCESTLPTSFATLICGIATQSGDLEICNAGHCPALLLQSDSVLTLEATGLPIGMFCSGPFPIQKLNVDSGTTLLLYTDGLSEAQNGGHEEYGTQRLGNLTLAHQGLSPRALIAACMRDLNSFRSGAAQTDDLALLVMKRQ